MTMKLRAMVSNSLASFPSLILLAMIPKKTIDDALAPGIEVNTVTGDQLAIAKETGRHLDLGDHMYPARVNWIPMASLTPST